MQKKGYALKRERGLVPHEYRRDERFHQGAFKNWPRRDFREHDRDYQSRCARLSRLETPSNNGYVRGHQFVG